VGAWKIDPELPPFVVRLTSSQYEADGAPITTTNISFATEANRVDASNSRADVAAMYSFECSNLQMATWTQTSPRRRIAATQPIVLITTCLGVFLAQLDTSVVNLALKQISAELWSSVIQLQWIVDGYNLAYAAFLLTGGTLGDILGRRRLFMTGVAFFTAGSLICGIAPDNATLIVGRTLTGLGAAFEMPTSLAILSDAYSDTAQRTRAIGVCQ
jgi:sugar phosphate permease